MGGLAWKSRRRDSKRDRLFFLSQSSDLSGVNMSFSLAFCSEENARTKGFHVSTKLSSSSTLLKEIFLVLLYGAQKLPGPLGI